MEKISFFSNFSAIIFISVKSTNYTVKVILSKIRILQYTGKNTIWDTLFYVLQQVIFALVYVTFYYNTYFILYICYYINNVYSNVRWSYSLCYLNTDHSTEYFTIDVMHFRCLTLHVFIHNSFFSDNFQLHRYNVSTFQ